MVNMTCRTSNCYHHCGQFFLSPKHRALLGIAFHIPECNGFGGSCRTRLFVFSYTENSFRDMRLSLWIIDRCSTFECNVDSLSCFFRALKRLLETLLLLSLYMCDIPVPLFQPFTEVNTRIRKLASCLLQNLQLFFEAAII
jgi:hypothetical protein